MKITIGEYCQFNLQGRMQLVQQYGEFVCLNKFEKKRVTIFRLFDFHVAVIRDLLTKNIVKADPFISFNLVKFYDNNF